ncbi:MAG: hypothetical protein H7330_07815 [Hymenobacteraceae bacterium]|nr:hypothetical protein [Hymenobacteraceae bacterium]
MKKRLLFSLLGLLLTSGCKKDPPPCETIAEAPPAFLAYWYFPEGSWWVYQLQDSVPAVFDTVRVVHRWQGQVESEPGEGRLCRFGYTVRYEHSNAAYFPGVPGKKGFEALAIEPKWSLSHYSKAGFYSMQGHSFVYPFVIGRGVMPDDYLTADTAQLTTPAGTFARTVHVHTDYMPPDSMRYSLVRDAWRSYGVGLTKIAFSPSRTPVSGTTWELVNYHIAP